MELLSVLSQFSEMEKAQVNKGPGKQMTPIRAGDHTRQQSLLGRDALEELQAPGGGETLS